MTKQPCPFPQFRGLRMHPRDQTRLKHAGEEFRVHLIALVIGLGDGS